MELWMHGLGDKPAENVKLLKELGFSAIVGGETCAEAAIENGLDAYICSGAYGYGGAFAKEEYLALDVNGDRRLWFGSTCPTKDEVRAQNIVDVQTMAGQKGIKGILIDGARFASPASADNLEAFFTCFCGGCMKKAEDMGFDARRMRKSAQALYRLCRGSGNIPHFIYSHWPGLIDWFSFRRKSTTEHLTNFSRAVKSVNQKLLTGIYLFTPSLAFLVGQHYPDIATVMDMFAPMIYRKYKATDGPACLNFELEAVFNIINGIFRNAARTEALLNAITGYRVTSQSSKEGFPTDIVYSETQKAVALANGKKVVPIIMLDDDQLMESISACGEGGADGVNFFVWDEKCIETAMNNGAFTVARR